MRESFELSLLVALLKDDSLPRKSNTIIKYPMKDAHLYFTICFIMHYTYILKKNIGCKLSTADDVWALYVSSEDSCIEIYIKL